MVWPSWLGVLYALEVASLVPRLYAQFLVLESRRQLIVVYLSPSKKSITKKQDYRFIEGTLWRESEFLEWRV